MMEAVRAMPVACAAIAMMAKKTDIPEEVDLLTLWDECREAICEQVSDDSGAREFAAAKLVELNFDGFCKDCKGGRRCSCGKKLFHSECGWSSLISHMDPAWDGASKATPEAQQAAYQRAVNFTAEQIMSQLKYYATEIYEGLVVVKKAIDETYDPVAKSISLERFVPWRDHIYDLEKASGVQVHWVIFQDDRSLQWRATAVSDETNRFTNRALLHESLRGLQGATVTEKLGCSSAESADQFFAHHSGFTGGAPTRDLLIKMLEFSEN